MKLFISSRYVNQKFWVIFQEGRLVWWRLFVNRCNIKVGRSLICYSFLINANKIILRPSNFRFFKSLRSYLISHRVFSARFAHFNGVTFLNGGIIERRYYELYFFLHYIKLNTMSFKLRLNINSLIIILNIIPTELLF